MVAALWASGKCWYVHIRDGRVAVSFWSSLALCTLGDLFSDCLEYLLNIISDGFDIQKHIPIRDIGLTRE